MDFFLLSLLNGLSYGLLLFLLCSGLTLIYSLLGVLNFAHAAFYALGAYLGYALSQPLGFWWALALVPLLTAVLTLMYYRKNLWTLIDVSMVIRPPLNFIKPESWFSRFYNFFFPDPARVALEAEVEAEKAKQDASMEAL
jgi:hypothetical protein